MEKEICGITVEKGNVKSRKVRVAELADGTPVEVPIIIVNGAEPGPTLYVQAGVHGDEPLAMEIASRVARETDPNDLSGVMIVVPIANVPAYLTRSHMFALEERPRYDMLECFPGMPNGSLTQRIAYFLYKEVILKADYVMDIHGGGYHRFSYPYAYLLYESNNYGTLTKMTEMTKALGTKFIMPWSVYTQFSHVRPSAGRPWIIDCCSRGILPTGMELGEAPHVSEEYLQLGVKFVENLMKYIGMLRGKPSLPEEQVILKEALQARNNRGGILHTLARPGQKVKEGDVIAEIFDAFGKVEDIVCPFSGFILMAATSAITYPGAEIFWLVR
jgi:hypothetical protein